MATNVGLPEGFMLDAAANGLPQGFMLDAAAPATELEKQANRRRTLEQNDTFTSNLARGAKKRALGVAQATGLTKLLPDEYEAAAGDLAKQYQDESQAAGFNFGEILGDPLTYLPIPGNINAATKGARALQAAKIGGKFGILGGATDPLTDDQSRLANTALQGTLGVGFGALSQPVMDFVSQGIKGIGQYLFKVNPEKIAQMEAAGLKPTVQATTDRPWVVQTANVLENIPGVGRGFKKTATGYEDDVTRALAAGGLKGDVQPEDAGRTVNAMIQRKEGIPLEQEMQDIVRQRAREASNLRNIIPNPRITEEQAGRSIAEGMSRKVGADIGLGSRIREDVIKAEQGVRVPLPDILSLRSQIPLSGIDDNLLKEAQSFLDRNAIWDVATNKRYIDADTLYQLKGLVGKATTPKEATTSKYIYSTLKNVEQQLAATADQQNKGAISSLVEKYGVNHTPSQVAEFEQQLYGRKPGTAAGVSVSQAADEFNQLFREGIDYKKHLLNKFTKEPIEQAGREVYAQKPLESTFQSAHSALQNTPSLFDEVSNSLTTPRQKNVFSANMLKLAGGDIGNTEQWVKNYSKLPERNRLSLVYGNKALKGELDNLVTRISSIPDKPTLATPLMDKFGEKSPEKVFGTIASDLDKGGTELANLRGLLTPSENSELTDGLYRHFASDNQGLSKIKWADEYSKMTNEARAAFANNDPALKASLDSLSTAINNIRNIQGFDTARNVSRMVNAGAMGASGLLALAFGIHVASGTVGSGAIVGTAMSKLMNDPNATRALANWTKLAPTQFGMGRKAALQSLYQAIEASPLLSDEEKQSLIKANESPVIRDPQVPGGYKLDMKGLPDATPTNPSNGTLPPVTPERDVPNIPLYNKKQEAGQSDYLDKLYQVESGGNAQAANPKSTATGLAQITDGTWRGLQRKYPQFRGKNKNDPTVQEEATLVLQQESDDAITAAGLTPDDDTRSFVHFLGETDSRKLLKNLDSNIPAAKLTPAAARSNPEYFYERTKSGMRRARTPREVFEFRKRKMSKAENEIQLARR